MANKIEKLGELENTQKQNKSLLTCDLLIVKRRYIVHIIIIVVGVTVKYKSMYILKS